MVTKLKRQRANFIYVVWHKDMKLFFFGLGLIFLLRLSGDAQIDIRGVDFKNFNYQAFCASEKARKVAVRSGEFVEEKQMDGFIDHFYFNVFDISYGDLTGDVNAEAVILTVCNTGGTGNFSEGFIYSILNSKPELLARIPGGDRAYGGLRAARIESERLIIDSNDVGDHGGACCPGFVITTRYKLVGNKIVESGKAIRRELYPKEPDTFAKGTSGKTFKTTIPAQDLKWFVVGAQAGQTLSVSNSSNQASLRLLNTAKVTEGVNNFVAVLPKKGR